MSVNAKKIKKGQHYCAGQQVREVLEVFVEEREVPAPKIKSAKPKAVKGSTKKTKVSVTRVRYRSRGHNAAWAYGSWYRVDAEKFARDVDKLVGSDYDPDYDHSR